MAEVGRWPAGELSPTASSVAGARHVVTGIFRTFDSRGDGMFSCAALANVLRALDTGAAMTDKEIDRLLQAIDTEHLGWIHYEAFCECIFGSMASQAMSHSAPLPSVRDAAADDKPTGGAGLIGEHVDLLKRPLGEKYDREAISRMTSSTIPPPEEESSSRTISDELEPDDSVSAEVPNPPGSAGREVSRDPGLNPLLILELAAIDGDGESSTTTPNVTTERIPRTPSTTGCLSHRAAERLPEVTATPTRGLSRQSTRASGRDWDSSRQPSDAARRPSALSQASQATELPAGHEDGEITGCPSLAASMSSVALTCPATSSDSPPWGRAQGQATVSFVSTAQDPNEQFRSYMEDGQKVIDPFWVQAGGQESWGFFAVYDGHGGRQAVDYCEERLHELVLAELQSLTPENDVNSALRGAFKKVDGELAMVGAWRTGCTATVALVHRTATTTTLYCANVGDSRAVLFGSVGARRISNDHRASDPAEAARIAEEGGLVRHGRVGGQLIVSRSLGDHHLKGCGVSCIPEVHECSLASDCALVIASDGLWDGLQDEEAGELVDRCVKRAVSKGGGEEGVREYLRRATAQELVDGAKDRGSRDNILALVVFF